MYFLNAEYFNAYETMNRAEFIAPRYFIGVFDYLIAVSHRWPKPIDPHIAYLNFLEIRNRIYRLIEERKFTDQQVDKIAVFYDYSCIYQTATSDDNLVWGILCTLHGSMKDYDSEQFYNFAKSRRQQDLDYLYLMLLCADEVYISKYSQKNYYTRCRCLVEALTGSLRKTLVDYAGPFLSRENIKYHDEFKAMSKRLDENLDDKSAIKAFQSLVQKGHCTVEEDRHHTMRYVSEIARRVDLYRSDSSYFLRDREILREIVQKEINNIFQIENLSDNNPFDTYRNRAYELYVNQINQDIPDA